MVILMNLPHSKNQSKIHFSFHCFCYWCYLSVTVPGGGGGGLLPYKKDGDVILRVKKSVGTSLGVKPQKVHSWTLAAPLGV